jgi:hypothetical protein
MQTAKYRPRGPFEDHRFVLDVFNENAFLAFSEERVISSPFISGLSEIPRPSTGYNSTPRSGNKGSL